MLPAHLIQKNIYFLRYQKKIACGLVDFWVMVQAELEQNVKHCTKDLPLLSSEMEGLLRDMELRTNGFRSSCRRFVEKKFDACMEMWRSLA